MRFDALDHLRLRVRRFVLLVVSEAAIADQIDQRVAPELAPEIDGEVHGGDAGVHVLPDRGKLDHDVFSATNLAICSFVGSA